MELTDAMRLAAHLKAAYPRMTLDEEEGDLFVREIARLPDTTTGLAAADRIIRTSERFPTIAEFRAQYRACAPRDKPALPDGPRDTGIPEWVHVWKWHERQTLTERQAANTTSRQPVADRPPVGLPPFPQMRTGYMDEFTGAAVNEKDPPPGAISDAEYEEIRQAWIEAGSPTIGSALEALPV